MKKILCTTIISVCFLTVLSAAQFDGSPNALTWYGFNSLLSSGESWNNGMIDDGDDQVFRKRRHRRKRKISPPKKGW